MLQRSDKTRFFNTSGVRILSSSIIDRPLDEMERMALMSCLITENVIDWTDADDVPIIPGVSLYTSGYYNFLRPQRIARVGNRAAGFVITFRASVLELPVGQRIGLVYRFGWLPESGSADPAGYDLVNQTQLTLEPPVPGQPIALVVIPGRTTQGRSWLQLPRVVNCLPPPEDTGANTGDYINLTNVPPAVSATFRPLMATDLAARAIAGL